MYLTLPATLAFLLARTVSASPAVSTITLAAPPVPTSTSYIKNSDFQNVVLSAHNFFRTEHNVSALAWNDTLADFAADHAKKCDFEHSGGPYGENLAAGYANATAAVEGWGNERQGYDFKKPTGFSEKTGHFTQLVWAKTTMVGCGREACNGEDGTPGFIVVCEYWPRGNIGGEDNQFYKENVKVQVQGKDTDTVATGITKTSAAARTTITATITVTQQTGFRLGLGVLCSFGAALFVL